MPSGVANVIDMAVSDLRGVVRALGRHVETLRGG